jgi:hypothetical protein
MNLAIENTEGTLAENRPDRANMRRVPDKRSSVVSHK